MMMKKVNRRRERKLCAVRAQRCRRLFVEIRELKGKAMKAGKLTLQKKVHSCLLIVNIKNWTKTAALTCSNLHGRPVEMHCTFRPFIKTSWTTSRGRARDPRRGPSQDLRRQNGQHKTCLHRSILWSSCCRLTEHRTLVYINDVWWSYTVKVNGWCFLSDLTFSEKIPSILSSPSSCCCCFHSPRW